MKLGELLLLHEKHSYICSFNPRGMSNCRNEEYNCKVRLQEMMRTKFKKKNSTIEKTAEQKREVGGLVIKVIMLRIQSTNVNDPRAFHAHRLPLPYATALGNVSVPIVPTFPAPYLDPPTALAE